MYSRSSDAEVTPLEALGLHVDPPTSPTDFLDVAGQVEIILRRGQGLAAVCAAAMTSEHLEVEELRHSLEAMRGFLEAAAIVVRQWHDAAGDRGDPDRTQGTAEA